MKSCLKLKIFKNVIIKINYTQKFIFNNYNLHFHSNILLILYFNIKMITSWKNFEVILNTSIIHNFYPKFNLY